MKKTIILLFIIYLIILVFSWLNSFVFGFMLFGFGISILFISPIWLFFFIKTTIDFIYQKSFLKLSFLWLYCAILTGLFLFLWVIMTTNINIGRIIPRPTESYSGNWSIEESIKDSLFLCEYEPLNRENEFLRDSAKINIQEVFIEKSPFLNDTTFYVIIQIEKGFKGYNQKWNFANARDRGFDLRQKYDKNGNSLGQYKIFRCYNQLPPDTIKFYVAEWITIDSLPESEKVFGDIIDSIVIVKKQ